MPRPLRLFAALALGLAAAACHRGEKSSGNAAPEPSSSIGGIAVAIDACTDAPFCQKRCDEGLADDCRRLAVAFQMGQGTAKDEARATALFEKACAMKNVLACVSAGQMYEFEHGVKKDVAKAAAYYKQACDAGYVPGCYNYAIMLEAGRGVPKDEWEAARYYQMACEAGAKVACPKAAALKSAPLAVDGGALRLLDAGADAR